MLPFVQSASTRCQHGFVGAVAWAGPAAMTATATQLRRARAGEIGTTRDVRHAPRATRETGYETANAPVLACARGSVLSVSTGATASVVSVVSVASGASVVSVGTLV